MHWGIAEIGGGIAEIGGGTNTGYFWDESGAVAAPVYNAAKNSYSTSVAVAARRPVGKRAARSSRMVFAAG